MQSRKKYLFNLDFKGKGIARTLLLLPMMSTPVATVLIWGIMYNPSIGVLNYFLKSIGLPGSLWIAHPNTVIPSLVLVNTWMWTPMIALICMAGLSVIPSDLYEAAKIDGASRWQEFFFITLPSLKPVTVLN